MSDTLIVGGLLAAFGVSEATGATNVTPFGSDGESDETPAFLDGGGPPILLKRSGRSVIVSQMLLKPLPVAAKQSPTLTTH